MNFGIKNFILFFSFFLFIPVVKAGSATIGFNSNNTVIVGSDITVSIYVGNIKDVSGGISTVGGNLVFDSSYLQLISSTGINSPFATIINEDNSYKIVGIPNGQTFNTTTNFFTFKFKALKAGNTIISFKNPLLGDDNGDAIKTSINSKTISIKEPPSTNNNLSSLDITNGTINFNKNITNYNVKVASNVASIMVNATSEDKNAKVSGTGNKTLNYGENKISIVVTAPSGDAKTYTIIVNREDGRSNNNNLASISISSGTLSPNFNSNVTNYNVNLPFNIDNIKVEAKALDDKAKVNISGNQNLKAGEVINIKIEVIAENGISKVYTINVARAKEVNSVNKKSSNNYLASLSLGGNIILNPKFSKNVTFYNIQVPYEVNSLKINAKTEDNNAKVNIKGGNNLVIGDNEVKIIVTAEDGKTKEYTIKVKRLEIEDKEPDNNPDDPVEKEPENNFEEEVEKDSENNSDEEVEKDSENNSDEEVEKDSENNSDESVVSIDKTQDMPHLLKSIKIINGNLTKKFNKNNFVYYYKKNKDFKIEAIANDEDDKVTIYDHNSVITIIVGNDTEESQVYTFIPKKSTLPIIIVTASATLGIGSFFIWYRKRFKIKKN